ncbi:acyl-CoA dehydrogenase family protein [Blastococcus sp. SYSU D00695]
MSGSDAASPLGIADPVERARSIAPAIRAAAADVESQGSLTDDVVKLLSDAELFWLAASDELGGGNAGLVETVQVIEEVTAADTSTGWSMMVNIDLTGLVSAHCSDATRDVVFGDGKPVFAGSLARAGAGVVTEVDGAMRLNGEFQFASGSAYADWFLTGATRDGERVTVIVPRSHVEFVGNWDVLGLRGTGSQDYRVTDYPVAPEMLLDISGSPRRGPAMHRLSVLQLGPVMHAGIALGVGRRAFEELTATARIEAAKPGRTPLTEQSHFMYDFIRLEAAYRGARAFCLEVAAEAQAVVERGEAASELLVARLYQATAHATRVARDAVEFAYGWSGTRALRTPNPLEKLLRDVHGITQHMIVGPPVVLSSAAPVFASY